MVSEIVQVDVPRTLAALGIECEQRGDELWACCPHPDHSEVTPSWSIKDLVGSERHGYHRCFGCKWGGGPIELVKVVLGHARGGFSLRYLRERGLLLEEQGLSELSVRIVDDKRRRIADSCMGSVLGIGAALETWSTVPRRYALSRGLQQWQVQRWSVGYAVDGYFAGRLVLPVYSVEGRWLAAAGRTFVDHPVRYLTSPREDSDPTAVFGEEHWPSRPERHTVVLCEAALNAMACERAGAQYVAALHGSEVQDDQMVKLSRFGRVLIATDNDTAGNHAADGIVSALARHCSLLRIGFPPGADPCDLERSQPGRLQELLTCPD